MTARKRQEARDPSMSAAEIATGMLADLRHEWQVDTERLVETAVVALMAELGVTSMLISTDKIVEHCLRYRAEREFQPNGMYSIRLVERNLDTRQSDLPMGEVT